MCVYELYMSAPYIFMNYVDVRGIKLRHAIYHIYSHCYAPTQRGGNNNNNNIRCWPL